MASKDTLALQNLGVVVVGRNEGDRLRISLESTIEPLSAKTKKFPVIYVDSGSTDGSVALALSLGVEVVELDPNIPFTAARAYNTGFNRLLELYPETQFVQFVDGDCEIVSSWLEKASSTLASNPEVFLVCGRRREMFPTVTIFHRLCDMEWNTLVGETTECGGESMIRVSAFQKVGGFDATLIAGEEPELCLRLIRAGGKLLRLDADTSIHDVKMTRWAQWWRRTMRAGYSFADVAWRHREGGERFYVRQTLRIWFWSFFLPLLALATLQLTQFRSLLVLLIIYLLLAVRIALSTRQRFGLGNAILYGFFCVIGRFPELQGQIEFLLYKLKQKQRSLIEYKVSS